MYNIFFRFQAYLYDIRGNTFCHRLTGHTDAVSEVAFHPAQPQVLKRALYIKIYDWHFLYVWHSSEPSLRIWLLNEGEANF